MKAPPKAAEHGAGENNAMSDAVTLKLSLPKVPDIELVALEGLDRFARHLGIAPEKVGEAKILMTEAIINAFEHSGAKNSTVRVELAMTTKEIIIYVRDFGEGFDPSTVPVPNIDDKLKSKSKRGWGLKLMQTLSDDFKIESGKRGTKITITKLLS
jgi:serine/threonine-protein kinase RsbW